MIGPCLLEYFGHLRFSFGLDCSCFIFTCWGLSLVLFEPFLWAFLWAFLEGFIGLNWDSFLYFLPGLYWPPSAGFLGPVSGTRSGPTGRVCLVNFWASLGLRSWAGWHILAQFCGFPLGFFPVGSYLFQVGLLEFNSVFLTSIIFTGLLSAGLFFGGQFASCLH